jgi:hypothetical protein
LRCSVPDCAAKSSAALLVTAITSIASFAGGSMAALAALIF